MKDFVDLQINGCWGIDFNSRELSCDDWQRARRHLFETGTHQFLPTIITDHLESIQRKVARLADWCEQANPTAAEHSMTAIEDGLARPIGIHIEGPFISAEPGYIGAHPKQFAIQGTRDFAQRLIDAGRGWVRMVTLAPEQDPLGETVGCFASQGILVAAGHTNATIDQLKRSIDHGLRCFTHLGNGCPATMPRHDNILHRVMHLRDSISVTLIADGHHLPPWFLKMLIDWFGEDRSIIVSDAISAAGLPAGFHTLGDRRVWVGDDGVPRSEDRTHFVGSGATLDRMLEWMLDERTWSTTCLDKMFRDNASRLLASAQIA